MPAFFDYADTKQALWRERSVQSVLNTIDSADVALFGVGSMSARLPSHVYSGGFLDPNEIAAAQNDGVVGDVCTVLIREDGSTNMHLNDRASGPCPSTLKKIPRRLCVVSGASKALPLLGALRAGVATDLVLDDGAAHELLDLVHTRTLYVPATFLDRRAVTPATARSAHDNVAPASSLLQGTRPGPSRSLTSAQALDQRERDRLADALAGQAP